MNLDRAREIWVGVKISGVNPDGLRLGLEILQKYVESINTRHNDGLIFACRLRDIKEMEDDDIRQMFQLGWHFDHHMKWWVFPDKQ